MAKKHTGGLTKGYVSITNGVVCKRFNDKSLADNYLKDNPDWHYGRSPYKKGWHHSEETKNKIRIANKGKKNPKLSIAQRGKVVSDTTRKKLSKLNTGKKQSVETVRKRVESRRGYKHSEETRRKIGDSNRGKKRSKDQIKILSESHKGIPSPRKGIKVSEESINKFKASIAKRIHKKPHQYQSVFERKIVEYFSNFFTVIPQFIIKGYHHPYDMMIELPTCKLLVEYDGSYYHSDKNPDYNKEADLKRGFVAKENGFEFLVIDENSFHANGELKYAKQLVAKYYPDLLTMHRSDYGHR